MHVHTPASAFVCYVVMQSASSQVSKQARNLENMSAAWSWLSVLLARLQLNVFWAQKTDWFWPWPHSNKCRRKSLQSANLVTLKLEQLSLHTYREHWSIRISMQYDIKKSFMYMLFLFQTLCLSLFQVLFLLCFFCQASFVRFLFHNIIFSKLFYSSCFWNIFWGRCARTCITTEALHTATQAL